MVKRPTISTGSAGESSLSVSALDEMLLAAAERGDESLQTGRYIITYKENAGEEGSKSLRSLGLRAADAREFGEQPVTIEDVGDADALELPELGIAIVSAEAAESRELSAQSEMASDSAIQAIEPDSFMFAEALSADYLRGFRRAVETLASEAGQQAYAPEEDLDVDAQVLGATWGLTACKVPPSTRSGAGIRVAILDTGMALNHPDFIGRSFVTASFVGQPVQDLNGHGTHCTGTACGPKAPPGPIQRYGIAHNAPIFIGKVLTNAGGGSSASVLAGMRWAIANRCAVISMSLGAQIPPQVYYTQAGQVALNNGCLMLAAAGNAASFTGAPANSPTIMSIASLDRNLVPSSFSNFGKVELAAPGRDIFSSWFMPLRYRIISGTSMACPHAAGCAALWAQTSPTLRGPALWQKLRNTARPLPYPPTRVGKGLVQAPA